MARNKKLLGWVQWLVALFIGIGVGTLFVDGNFLNAVILSWFPEIVHTIVGWVIIGGAVWEAIQKFM